jgi:hypothetical protein
MRGYSRLFGATLVSLAFASPAAGGLSGAGPSGGGGGSSGANSGPIPHSRGLSGQGAGIVSPSTLGEPNSDPPAPHPGATPSPAPPSLAGHGSSVDCWARPDFCKGQ